MRYFLLSPLSRPDAWQAVKRVSLCSFKDSGLVLSYCEGEEPSKGATGLILDGPEGMVAWWPIYSTPPKEVYRTLAEIQPHAGEENEP